MSDVVTLQHTENSGQGTCEVLELRLSGTQWDGLLCYCSLRVLLYRVCKFYENLRIFKFVLYRK